MKTKRISLDQLLTEMSFGRDQYKENLARHLYGGLREYCKLTCALKNGQTNYTVHWATEVERLIEKEFPLALIRPTKFKDKRKAALEEIEAVKSLEKSARRYGENAVRKDFGLTKIETLDDSDLDQFWALVMDQLDEITK